MFIYLKGICGDTHTYTDIFHPLLHSLSGATAWNQQLNPNSGHCSRSSRYIAGAGRKLQKRSSQDSDTLIWNANVVSSTLTMPQCQDPHLKIAGRLTVLHMYNSICAMCKNLIKGTLLFSLTFIISLYWETSNYSNFFYNM